ncbi:hypothetical protein Tco_1505683 [Tanacetum coccineum]
MISSNTLSMCGEGLNMSYKMPMKRAMIPTDSHHTPTTTQPSTSKPQKKQSRRKQRKTTEDPQLSGPTEPVTDDTENMAILALETTKTNQAPKIDSLKKRVKKIENKKGSKTYRLRRLYKVGRSAGVVSSEDEGRYGDNLMFDTGVLDNEQDMVEKEVDIAEKDVSTADPVTTAGEVVTTANVVVSTAKVTTDRANLGIKSKASAKLNVEAQILKRFWKVLSHLKIEALSRDCLDHHVVKDSGYLA